MASDSDDPDYEYHIEWNDGTNVKGASGSRTASAHSRATSSKSRGARNKGKQPMKTVAESSKTAAARPYDGASQPQSHQTSQPASRPSTAEGRKATPNGRPLKTPPVAAGPSNGASVMRTFGHFLQATHQNGQGSNVNWQNAIYSRNQRGEPIAPNNQDVFTNREWGDMRAPGSVVQGPQDVSIEGQSAFFAPAISAVFLDQYGRPSSYRGVATDEWDDDDLPVANAAATAMNVNLTADDFDVNLTVPLLGPAGFLPMNAADRAERAGQDPDDFFVLPVNRHNEFDARFFGPRNNNVLHIAKKTNTHLSLPEESGDHTIYIWGTKKDIAAAKADLMKLMKMTDTEIDLARRRVGGWAKVRAAPSDRKQIYLENLLKDFKERAKFRKSPLSGETFRFVGVFYWPNKEVNPQTVLGLAFEAFDEIRTDQKVYILYDRAQGVFRVLGSTMDSVNTAVARIYGTFCEIAAKNRRPNRMILVMPPDELSVRRSVHIDRGHPFINRQVTVKRVEGNSGIQLYLPESEDYPDKEFMDTWSTKKDLLGRANMNYMRRVVQQGLGDVAYYRGYAKLKIYFGQLVLFGYKRSATDTYGLLELMDMMHASQTHGEVIRTLANPDLGCSDGAVADELLAALKESPAFHAVDINQDTKVTHANRHEEHISATFELRLYDDSGKSTEIRLEVDFTRTPNTREYKAATQRWINISDRRESRRKGPVDIKVFDIKTTVAYHMELSTWQSVPDTDIYPIFQEFVRRLRVEDLPDPTAGPRPAPGDPDTRPTIRRISFTNLPGLSVATLVQKTKYRFWMFDTRYIFELIKYESLPVENVSMMFPDGIAVSYRDIVEAEDVRYGAALWNDEWDSHLREQAYCKIGEKGSWDPEIDVFFKPSKNRTKINGTPGEWDQHDGFGECIGRVNNLIEFIVQAQGNAARLESDEAEADQLRLKRAAEIGTELEEQVTQYTPFHTTSHAASVTPSQNGTSQNGTSRNSSRTNRNIYNHVIKIDSDSE